MQKPITSGWVVWALAGLSGLLFACSMPGVGAGAFAWFAFVPLLLAVQGQTGGTRYLLFNLTGIIGSIGTHIWYPDILGPGLGYFLMAASGLLYGSFLQLGYALQQRVRSPLNILILPVVWTALEWLRFVLPVTREWWIEVLAKSQWLLPAPLQWVSLTGFSGLSFLIMLSNSALAGLIITALHQRRLHKIGLAALLIPAAAVVWGAYTISQGVPQQSQAVKAAANVDLVNQDPAVQRLGGQTAAGDGYIADTPAMSQAIFDLNAELTKQAKASGNPAFVVWGENEFAAYGDEAMIGQLKQLAAASGVYIAADVTWESDSGLHDTALLIGPDGKEVGKTPKIKLTDGEMSYGFVPGTRFGQVYETAYGKVGLAICWDRHAIGVIRALAKNGAGLVLLPADDDFNGNAVFPKYAASDSVFRAVENRVGMIVGTTSGVSQIITPYGVMAASSAINKRGFIVGETFAHQGPPTLYNKWGDWFAVLMVIVLLFLLADQARKAKV